MRLDHVDQVNAEAFALRHTDRARAMAHAAFGLINSTPHSGLIPDEAMRGVLQRMAMGALVGP